MSKDQRGIFETSIDTQLVIDHLKEKVIGDIVSWEEVEAILGRVRPSICSNVRSARNFLEREEHIFFESIKGVGFKRIADEDVVGIVKTSGVKRVRSLISRQARRLKNISDFDGMSNEKKVEHNTTLSVLGAMILFSRNHSVAKVTAVVEEERAKLSVANTLKLFLPKEKKETTDEQTSK
jgi:hypothetical protein